MKQILTLISITAIILSACDPQRDDDLHLGPAPDAPQFTAEILPNDSNRVVVRNLSEGNFQLLWDLQGGIPKTSHKNVDTILYTDAGQYTITLFVSKADGN